MRKQLRYLGNKCEKCSISNITFTFLIVGIWDWYHWIGVKQSFLMAYSNIPFDRKTTEIFEVERTIILLRQ